MTSGVRRPRAHAATSSAAVSAPHGERGTARRQRGPSARPPVSSPPSRSPRPAILWHIPSLERQEVREQTIGAGNPGRQLAEEREAGIDVGARPHTRYEQPAPQRWAARLLHLDERCGRGVPVVSEVETALLHPALPV